MHFFAELVDSEHLRVRVVVPDQETVLFALEPTLAAGEDDDSCAATNFVVHIILLSHVLL